VDGGDCEIATGDGKSKEKAKKKGENKEKTEKRENIKKEKKEGGRRAKGFVVVSSVGEDRQGTKGCT